MTLLAPPLAELYTKDETAWLDAMVEVLQSGNPSKLDLPNLQEYLSDMAHRDRREVDSRIVVLLLHILKWTYQPAMRSRGWHSTILEQQHELDGLVGKGVLRNHAEDNLSDCYAKALQRAAVETGLPLENFPTSCPMTLDELLAFDCPV